MKKIKYQLQDVVQDVEVSDEFAEEYERMMQAEKKVERKETRRHNSMEGMSDAGFRFEAKGYSIEEVLEKEALAMYEEKLGDDVGERLEREAEVYENWLCQYITERQAEVFARFYMCGMSKVDIAEDLEITESAVRKLLKKAEDGLSNHDLLQYATRCDIAYSQEEWDYIVGDEDDEYLRNYKYYCDEAKE